MTNQRIGSGIALSYQAVHDFVYSFMRVLLIKLRHIGDALLTTPVIAGIRQTHPNAEITMLVRSSCRHILEGCRDLDRILTTADIRPADRQWSSLTDDMKLIRELRHSSYDVALDLGDNYRGRFLLTLTKADLKAADAAGRSYPWYLRHRVRILNQSWAERKSQHRVEKDYRIASQVLNLPVKVPPLQFDQEAHQPWPELDRNNPYIVIHAGTRWKRKRWPLENWCHLLKKLKAEGHRLVISCGPDAEEREEARQLQNHLGDDTLTTDGQCSWRQLAWILAGARLFIGVDTAAMHLAAACQCPTVALFGPSRPQAWSPWCVPHTLVRPPDEVLSRKPERSDIDNWMATMIRTISVDEVWKACQKMLSQDIKTNL